MPSKYTRERLLMKNKPRKVLNLEERVLAIRLYQQTPVYQRVATVFKCSWEQIKNVVRNSDEILQYYKRCQVIEPTDSAHYVRYKKINFLGSAMYEFIKRAYYHRSATLNNETLRKKALQFRDILKIDRFYPNWAWVADFKHVFNIDYERLHTLIIHEPPHKSLDGNDIVAHCTRTVERSLACSGKIKSAKGAAANKSNADDYDSAEEDFENADDVSIIGRFEQNDAEDVAAASEGDDFKDQYLDEGDADDDEINENEEGPTIDFGAYEYDVEMHELSAATPTPPAADAQATATKATTAKSLPANSPMRTELQAAHSPDVQIKVECRSRSPSPVSNTAMPPPANRSALRKTSTATVEPSSCTLEATNTNATTTTTGSISSYAEALQWLRPLEDFACQEEDFHAVNLLAQLAQVYERQAKRPKTFHSA